MSNLRFVAESPSLPNHEAAILNKRRAVDVI